MFLFIVSSLLSFNLKTLEMNEIVLFIVRGIRVFESLVN